MLAPAPPEPPAFVVGYRSQVFVAPRDGRAHRLTGGITAHQAPVWSPSGGRVAASTRHGLVVLTPGGQVRHEIRVGSDYVGAIAWGPGGHRLAYTRYRCGPSRCHSTSELVVSDLDGRPLGTRTIARHVRGFVEWSPDGQSVFFTRGRGYYSSRRLYAVSPDGGPRRRIAGNVSYISHARVSPDGRWVLFRRDALWIAATDGSGAERRIGYNPGYLGLYGWLDGGRAIFGGKARHHHPVITTLAGERRVLGVKFFGGQYTLSPDGRRVAWVRYGEVGSARVDGSDERVVARFSANNNTVDVDTLAWSPDGSRLLVEPYKHSGD
jgi:Tol biopolymer transport system component